MVRLMVSGLALVAPVGMAFADEQVVLHMVGDSTKSGVYCEVTLLPDGQVTTRFQQTRNSFPEPDMALEATPERLSQFRAVVDAIGSPDLPVIAAEDEPQDMPHVSLVVKEGEGDNITRERRVFIPGTEIPAVAASLFGPLHDGGCMAPTAG